MSNKSIATIATMGIDIGKNSFHVVGLDQRGAIVLRQKWSRGQIEARVAAMPPCLIGMEACVGAHHLSRKLQAHGHDGPGHNTLQSEAGYIDARPQSRQIDETSCDARPDHTCGSVRDIPRLREICYNV